MDEGVRDDAEAGRYVLEAGGETAIAAYEREGDRILFTHTEVPVALEGQGVGSRLVKGALDDVRARGLKVTPACAFVRRFIETHPEYRDLV